MMLFINQGVGKIPHFFFAPSCNEWKFTSGGFCQAACNSDPKIQLFTCGAARSLNHVIASVSLDGKDYSPLLYLLGCAVAQ